MEQRRAHRVLGVVRTDRVTAFEILMEVHRVAEVAQLRRQDKEWRNVRLYGQERNLMTSSIARMNCFLHGIEDFQIVRGDTLSEPKFIEGDSLMRFDVVLANPPYSIKQWDRDAFASLEPDSPAIAAWTAAVAASLPVGASARVERDGESPEGYLIHVEWPVAGVGMQRLVLPVTT